MKQLLKPGLSLIVTLFLLLFATSCGNESTDTSKANDRHCGITPELKKILKHYNNVFQVNNGLILVESKTIEVHETFRNYFPKGCIDMKGNVVIPLEYESISIGDGALRVSKYTNHGLRFGLLDMDGHEILPMEYDEIFWPDVCYSNSFIRVRKNGFWGVVDKKGVVQIPIQYESVNRFYVDAAYTKYDEEELPDIFVAWKDGKPNLFNLSPDKKMKQSTPYDVILIGEYGSQSFMDNKGNIIAGPYQNVRVSGDMKMSLFPEGLAAVVKNNKVGFIDMQGNVKIPFEFDYTEFMFNIHSFSFGVFNDGLAAMMKMGNKWGFIDKSGNTVIPFNYDYAGCFHEGSAIVGKVINNEEWCGLIDKNNKEILPFVFENGVFSGNVYVMCQNNKWGVYSPKGDCITPCQYDQQITFIDGYATVVKDGKKGLIDEQGQLLIPCQYDACLYDMKTNLVFVVKDGKQGFVNLRNEVVVPILFDSANPCGDNAMFIVQKDGRYGLYDLCGNCTLEGL